MKQKTSRIFDGKTIIILIASIIALGCGIAALIFFGISTKESRNENFSQGEGYIISSKLSEDGTSSTRQYFDASTTYRSSRSGDIEFKNTSEETVQVGTDSFIHYLDGSIGILQKSAILDLETLTGNKDKVITYYNMLPSVTLKHLSNQYVAELQGKQISFDSLLVKITENKFLLAAPKIEVKVGDATNVINNGYVEINYFDGDIIRIENQELTFQSISKDISLDVGDTHIDLTNRLIFKDKTDVLALGLITINSDDNITLSDYVPEIAMDDESSSDDESSQDDSSKNNQDSSTSDSSTSDSSTTTEIVEVEEEEEKEPEDLLRELANGIIESQTIEGEINEYERSKDPVFSISEYQVTPNSLTATINAKDTDGVLTGDTTVELVNVATSETIYRDRYVNGETTFEIHTENLVPDTNYVLAVTAGYNKDETVVNRTFIQKTFMTEALGITMQEKYASTSEISILVEKADYSRVTELYARLYDLSGNPVYDSLGDRLERVVDLSNDSSTVTFSDLNYDTGYLIRLEDVTYDNIIFSDQLHITKETSTLKRKPEIGQPTYVVDKVNSNFILNMGNTKDPDNGIVNYRYEIYNPSRIEDGPIYTIDKADRSSTEVHVDNKNLKHGEEYIFRVVVEFNDNLRTYEFASAFASSNMSIDGKTFPTLRFDEVEVTFEKIDGTIVILDADGVIPEGSTIYVTYTDSVGGLEHFTATDKEIPFIKDNLRKRESYTISIYAKVDLQDGNPPIDSHLIGSIVVQTRDTNPFALSATIDPTSSNAFSINARLVNGNQGDTELEANTLSGLTFNIYEGTGTSGELLRSTSVVDDDTRHYFSTLRNEYYDEGFVINPRLFGLSNDALSINKNYTIEVTGAHDYTTHKNSIDILDNVITVKASGSGIDIPEEKEDAIEVIPIYNTTNNLHYNSNLNTTTIIGYSIRGKIDNSNKVVQQLTYVVHNEDGDAIGSITKHIGSDGEIGRTEFYLEDYGLPFDGVNSREVTDFRRGDKYYFTFTAKVSSDGRIIDWPGQENGVDIVLRSKIVAPEKQEPTFLSYPVDSTNTTATWRYTLYDPDNSVIIGNGIIYYDGQLDPIGMYGIEKTAEEKEVTFTNLQKGDYSARLRIATISKTAEIRNYTVINHQEFEGIHEYQAPNYLIDVSDNRAIFRFQDYSYSSLYNRIARVDLTLRTDQHETTLENLSFTENGTIEVSLSSITELAGQDISPEFTITYDNGRTGFGLLADTSPVAIKLQSPDGSSSPRYLAVAKGNDNIYYDTLTLKARSSIWQTEFTGDSITAINSLTQTRFSYPAYKDMGGIKQRIDGNEPSTDKIIYIKNLESISASGPGTFRFEDPIPGISLPSDQLRVSFNSATINANVYGATNGSAIHVKLYKTDSKGLASELLSDTTVTVQNGVINHTFDELSGDTYYYLQFCAMINSECKLLYDVDEEIIGKNYYFRTLRAVQYEYINLSYNKAESTQSNRKLKLEYKIESGVSVSYVDYEIWESTSDGTPLNLLSTIDDQPVNNNTINNVNIPMLQNIVTSRSCYIVKIVPYHEENGISEPLDVGESSVYNFFYPLNAPWVGVSSHETADGTGIVHNVKIMDGSRTIVDTEQNRRAYTIQIIDELTSMDVTPEEYRDQEYSAVPASSGSSTYSNSFTLNKSDFNVDRPYALIINYQVDRNNETSSYQSQQKYYSFTFPGVEGFSSGNLVATAGQESGSIQLLFMNSKNLNTAVRIRAYVFREESVTPLESESSFTPTQSTGSTGTYYSYTIPNIYLNASGEYYIQIQLLNTNDEVLSDDSTTYYYRKDS